MLRCIIQQRHAIGSTVEQVVLSKWLSLLRGADGENRFRGKQVTLAVLDKLVNN